MNARDKKAFEKYIKDKKAAVDTLVMAHLFKTVTGPEQEKAYTEVKDLIEKAGISVAAGVITKNMDDAVKILKSKYKDKCKNLKTKVPPVAAANATVLKTDAIAFLVAPHTLGNGPTDEFSFAGNLTQDNTGKNNKQINYKVKRCSIGLAVACDDIVDSFFADANDVTEESRNLERQLKSLATDSLKHLPLKTKGKDQSTESTRYQAAGRMELRCTQAGSNDVFSFLL